MGGDLVQGRTRYQGLNWSLSVAVCKCTSGFRALKTCFFFASKVTTCNNYALVYDTFELDKLGL